MAVMEAIKERPILFSAPMVRAILNGQKTQTRRVIKPQPSVTVLRKSDAVDTEAGYAREYWLDRSQAFIMPAVPNAPGDAYRMPSLPIRVFCPYGAPGERLWVRETFAVITGEGSEPSTDDLVRYRADEGEAEDVLSEVKAWKPSIHIPRCYSRIDLEVVSVRVERLQEISGSDVLKEGVMPPWDTSKPVLGSAKCQEDALRGEFINLWESINGAGSWEKNPWVWCITFTKL